MHHRHLRTLITAALLLSLTPAAYAAGPGDEAASPSEVTVTGEVHRIVMEPADGPPVTATAVVPAEGDAVQVEPGALTGVPTGAVVEVVTSTDEITAQATADAMDTAAGATVAEVTVVELPATASGPFTASELGEAGLAAALPGPSVRPVHVLTATFTGATSAPGVTTARLMQDVTTAVAPYWADSTGGALQFTAGTQASGATYSGWGTTASCSVSQILGALAWAASQTGQAPTVNNARHVVMYTAPLPACGFAGVANVSNGGSAWLNGPAGAAPSWGVMAHELGHTLTLEHSNSLAGCTTADGRSDPCRIGEYGDAYDVMGWQSGNPGPLSAAQLDVLGLLTAQSTVETAGPASVTLAPVGSLSGKRFLVFTSGSSRYYVEYRGAVGRDADLASTRKGCPGGVPGCTTLVRYVPGVVVHRIDADQEDPYTQLLDAGLGDPAHTSGDPLFVLPAGRSFTTADNRFRLTVESVTAAGATVRLTGAAPLGAFDSATGVPTGVQVSGWALDPQTTASSYVWVDVAGKGQLVRASTERPDVGRLFPTYGSAHGFSATIAAPAGRHQVCVTAINVASGPHTSLGCRTVTVPTTAPLGSMDSATAVTGGVRVRGWALDPQTPAPSYVWVDVAGKGQLTRASISRGDIGAAFPALGPDHGFDLTLSAPPGPQLVCATAVEVSTGPHTFLGCRTVIVPDTSPVGRVDAATPTTGGILLQGWALDPDTTASSWIWVDLDGRDGRPVRASTPRSDIAAAFPGYGPNHGFSTVLNTTPGTHTACVTAINTAAGTNKFLGCATTRVP